MTTVSTFFIISISCLIAAKFADTMFEDTSRYEHKHQHADAVSTFAD